MVVSPSLIKHWALNPNLAAAWNFSGWIRIMLGEHQSAIERFERALRLSPRDPTVFHMRAGIAYALSLRANMTLLRLWHAKL